MERVRGREQANEHVSHRRDYCLTEGSSGAIVGAATAVAVVAAVAVAAFSERGERAGEVGGDGSDDGWDIVDTLAIEGCTVR